MLKGYKLSKFNIYKKTGTKFMVYNTYSQNLCDFQNIESDDFAQYVKDGKMDEEQFQKCIDLGFIIKNSENEDNMIDDLRKKYVEEPNSLYLYILPTEECNFRCKYCYENFRNIWMTPQIQDSIIAYVRKNIYKYKMLRVEWFGGEPLLALDIVEYMSKKFIEICREEGVIYVGVMTTNAYTMDLHTFERLRKCHILSYQITLDGMKDTHDKQRVLRNQQGTFEQIMNNLINIRKYVKTNALDITIRVNVSKDLLGHIYEFIDYLKCSLLDDHRFKLLLKPVGNYGGDRIKEFENQICNVADLSEINKYCSKLDIDYRENREDISVGGGVCYAARNHSWVIGADGKIYKCTVLLYDEVNHIGDVGKDGEFNVNPQKLDKWVGSCQQHKIECSNCECMPICLKSICYKRVVKCQEMGCSMIKMALDNFLDESATEAETVS